MNERGHVQIQVLGPIQVIDREGDVVTLSPQLKRLVGLLVVAHGAPVSASRLAEYVADGNTEGSTVRTAVSRLRKILGDDIEAFDGGYRLMGDDHDIDLRRFESLRSSASPTRIDDLAAALELFRGRPFGDLADEEWATGEASRLESERAATTEDLAEALIVAGRPGTAIELLEPHNAEHPYRERPVALLMRALADDGRTADALRTFQRFRAVLRDDVGLDPSSELRALEGQILAATDDTRTPTAPAPAAPSVLPEGTVTFMFTDIESSTQRWQADEARMSLELDDHDQLLARVIGEHQGIVFKHTGDGVCAVFTSSTAAIDAAVAAQGELDLPVRIGVHTGEAERRGHDYFGPTLNRVARVMDAGHGGQVLVSAATASLIDHDLIDLGQHRLKGLSSPEQIFQVGNGEFPPLRVERDRKGNLPTESSSFIGRTADIDKVAERVASDHVVTLLGVGGTGKTRLAIEVAQALAPTFPDGCWMAELAPINIAEAVPFAIAAGLGLSAPQSGDIIDHVIKRIRHQRLLLIVDNCEHLLSPTADAVERIAAACPAVTVLSTSREPLMVNGETLSPVPSLSADDAVELFLARAATEAPDLHLDDAQLAAITELCERLDRLPLAIELAASRLRSLTPVELLGSIDERLRLLVGGRRSRMERHQTMRGTLDWSYDLCTPIEQDVFNRLSVFPAGFTLTSARAVASGGAADELDVIDAVPRLVDRSLLQRITADDGTSRYRMLETMRAYGREHLQHGGTADEVRERHARHVADTLRPLGLRMIGPDERAVTAEMATWLADAVVAVDWAAEHEKWDVALDCKLAGYASGMRQMDELDARISTAALTASGDIPLEISLIPRDLQSRRAIGSEALEAILDGRWVAPTDRFVIPPHIYVEPSFGSDAAEQLVATLDGLTDAAAGTRALAYFFTVMSAYTSGLGDLTEPLIERFADLANEYDSEFTHRRVANCRAGIARMRGDWHEASRWSAVALDGLDNPTFAGMAFIAVNAGFRQLGARAAAGLPITASQLREPWDILGSEGVGIQQWVGAHATATALGALGHRELACRFLSFVRAEKTIPDDFLGVSAKQSLAAVGLDWELDSAAPCTDTLDDLLAELMVIADTLDTV
jgi:predicted ATPase/class 3 adenylate cyclase/DNA-binding winged helix-turn-helix (wHTH) protein